MKRDRIVRVRIGVSGEEGLEFTGLKIVFRVDKTPTSESNTCQLSIYNLNSDSRSKISTKDSVLFLYAGYEKDVGEKLIFTGDVTNATTELNKPDVITSIEAGDGDKKLKDVKLSISFKEGGTVYQVVKKALDKFELPIKTETLLESLKRIKYANGKSFIGTAKKLLDLVFAGTNMQWSIQNDEIKFYEDNKADNSTAIVLRTGATGENNTGIIGSPKKAKIKTGKKTDSPDVDGWIIQTLLEPRIEPGGVVEVSSKEVPAESKFKIVNVSHSGDSLEGEFTTTLECIEYEQ